jgi:hypothetical protein
MKAHLTLDSLVASLAQPTRKAWSRLKPHEIHELTRPGTLHELRVAHDDWCGALRGGQCSCDPTVEVIEHNGD